MMQCPRCAVPLGHAVGESRVLYACPRCGGRAGTLPVLRRVLEDDVVNRMWQGARYAPRTAGLPCPQCRRNAQPVVVPVAAASVPVDVCTACQVVWFDATELESLPHRELAAAATTEPLRRRARPDRPPPALEDDDRPRSAIEWVLGVLGMPIERDTPVRRGTHLLTRVLVLATVVVSLWAMAEPRMIERWAFLPSQPWRHGGVTFLTAFLLHAGFFHLFGNMYFLWTFGDDVEDLVGAPRFLGLLVAATIAGNVAHMLFTRTPNVPCIGASGGISGVLAFYAFAFPRTRISLLFGYFWWVTISARAAFLLWLGLQTLFAVISRGPVSHVAHIGGAVLGFAAWAAWRPHVPNANAVRSQEGT